MREILFRGKTCGKWVYGSLIYTGKFCCILEPEDSDRYDYPYLDADLGVIDGEAIPVDPSTVGQYTGFNDKNGEKIFEGDIVKYNDDDIYKVFWSRNDCTFYIDGFNCCDIYRLGNLCNHLCEKIGNIHDNPELLKGE